MNGMIKKQPSRTWPIWVSKALQGVAYWVGHRQSLYSRHELSEGALTAEICNLIHANLQHPYLLRCEKLYRTFLPRDVRLPDKIAPNARADLSVWERFEDKNGRYRPRPRYVIEVKRASATRKRIDEELQRLAAVVERNERIRGFLFVIGERRRPDRFVSEEGEAKKKRIRVDGFSSKYSVLRVWVATRSFKDKDRAHYACLIEVARQLDR